VGWNAGAGMTGGTAYLIDWRQLNPDSVVAREVPTEDEPELRALVEEHHRRTGSQRAASLLSNWADSVSKFRQIVPVTIGQPAATPEPATAQENVAPSSRVV
jgi:glutamate synthase domain-containing protein 3